MQLNESLEKLGLTEKEAKIYLALLELGVASVQKIAKKAAIPRATAYDLLESLKNQQLAFIVEKDGKKRYSPTDPGMLIKNADQKKEIIKNIFPELKALYSLPSEKPNIKFYEGVEGMKIIFEENLKDKKENYSYGSADDIFEQLDFFPEFVKKRIKTGIHIKVLLRESEKARERQRLGQEQLREVKIIPAKYEFNNLMTIFGNKIAMFTFKKKYIGILIESEELAEMQKAIFNLIWENIA